MNRQALFAALSFHAVALGTAFGPAHAIIDPQPNTQRIVVSGPQLSTDPASAPAAVLAAIGSQTTFSMANGRLLVVEATPTVLRMRYNRRAAVVLKPDGQGSFSSHDGVYTLHVHVNDVGEAESVRLALPADRE